MQIIYGGNRKYLLKKGQYLKVKWRFINITDSLTYFWEQFVNI